MTIRPKMPAPQNAKPTASKTYTLRILFAYGVCYGDLVKISETLHDDLRLASLTMSRSINAQAEHWIRIGMLAELNPELTYPQLVKKMMKDNALTLKEIVGLKDIVIKTPQEIAIMRHSGALLAKVFAMLDEVICEGITTMEINDRTEAFIVNELKSRPASKGQYDFPYVLNTSIDEVICHGIPSASKILRSGMIVNVDITLENNGFIADSSKMYCIGQNHPARQAPGQQCLRVNVARHSGCETRCYAR
ncbi:Methionine aminopeptidase [Serratia fonticola]|uniref:Methionine aminopeptidase n=1 Tax=Serratia fonticola TaxID=47917 RepID=A0A4U9W247_SERFO|nr:Methionine aminopeptidase [Serratia fonticola]